MRYVLSFLVAVVLITVSLGQAQAIERAEIAAIVNDDIITTMDIKTRLMLNTGGRPIPKSEQNIAYNTILDELINEVIQRQEMRSLNITIEDQQVRDAFAAVARNNGRTVQEMRTQFSQMGIPVESLYDKLETDIGWAQVVKRKLRPQINISETDIDAVFDDLDRTKGKAQYRVAEIFVASDMTSDSQTAAKKKIDGLMQQIVNKGSFPDIAKRHSESPGASRGGDLGWLLLEQLDKDFQPVILKMKRGQVSPPFKTSRGYHILLLIDQKMPASAKPAPASVEKAPVAPRQADKVRLQQIFLPIAENEPTALRAAKMGLAKSLQAELNGCNAMKAKFENFQSPLTGDLGYVSLTDLPADVATAVNGLTAGTLSEPMVNAQGIFVMMVCDRKVAPKTVSAQSNQMPNSETRGDEDSREQVANKIGLQKLEILEQRYLRDLRGAAFIDRRI